MNLPAAAPRPPTDWHTPCPECGQVFHTRSGEYPCKACGLPVVWEDTRADDPAWIQTYTGGRMYLLDPRIEDIRLPDIIHALANVCRYAGHIHRFYCPTPDQRILTHDLRWVPAGDLKVGDGLLAFDERAVVLGSAGKARRRFRYAVVTHAVPIRRSVVRLELEDGTTLRSSSEHPWLIATKVSNNQVWATASDIAVAVSTGRARYMNRFVDTWKEDTTRDAGWLAGMYDGEGHASFRRKGIQSGVAQRPGPVLDAMLRLHHRFGFDFSISPVGDRDVISLQLRGGWRELARLLGSLRPIRLLNNFTTALKHGDFCKQLSGHREPLRVVAAYNEGEEWVSGLETSTHTYFCEGFGAHNSVAQHSCVVAGFVPRAYKREALLHDATEAYLMDIPRPYKITPLFAGYREVEERLEKLIAQRFNLTWPWPKEVKEADNLALATEADQHFHNCEWRHAPHWPKPASIRIAPKSPSAAKEMFMRMIARYFPEEKVLDPIDYLPSRLSP